MMAIRDGQRQAEVGAPKEVKPGSEEQRVEKNNR